MSTPPGHKPPGWKRPSGMGYEREASIANTVGGFLKRQHDAAVAKKAKRPPKGRSATVLNEYSFKPLRDPNGMLHDRKTGKFVKDTEPANKREPRTIPWNKGKRYKRKKKT